MPTDRVRSTYRVQLHGGWTFAEAAALTGYVAALGASHLYCSPYLQAAPGSTHGYDVVDPTRVNEELGGEAGRAALVAALRDAGLGQVLDVVPNHMSVAVPDRNPWWWDVLRHGRGSPYAGYFDVDWDAESGRVVLPVLGDEPDVAVKTGELTADGEVLRYHEHTFPLAPGTAGVPLPDLLDRQHYRLAHWREAARSLNYRRFFDVTTLAGVRVERDEVFDATHARIAEWLRAGELDGVRVDHPDGLADPAGYTRRLRALTGHDRWLVVEKILEPGESLPGDWPVDGTTGYDAATLVGGLFVDPAGEAPLTELYGEVTGERRRFADVVREGKLLVLRTSFGAEVSRLARLAGDGAQVRDALVELLAAMPVYRTYLVPGRPASGGDRVVLATALATAEGHRPDLVQVLRRLVDRLLAGDPPELTVRFQQASGAATAKGVEDTAFYRYHRLVALNEVGGDPGTWGTPVAGFQARCGDRQQRWPFAMTTLSTHDTKRSEDVRARLAVLSELPGEWAGFVHRWLDLAARHRTGELPDRNMEYLLLQTFAGAHPLPVDRALGYAEKASREAKQHTSWVDPEPAYDDALARYVRGTLGDPALGELLAELARRIEVPGRVNALAQKLVQLTMPGVPDVYQGSELWDHSLVDPDNRRAVDHDLRRRLLAELDRLTPAEVMARSGEGLPKLLVTSRALRLRRDRPELFGPAGDYEPLAATGPLAGHVVAFTRGGGAATVVPRLPTAVSGGWRGTTVALPGGPWRDQLTGRSVGGGDVALDGLLDPVPVALLVREHA